MIRFILSCPFIQHYKVEKRLVSFFYFILLCLPVWMAA
jgi:hypothetical protein